MLTHRDRKAWNERIKSQDNSFYIPAALFLFSLAVRLIFVFTLGGEDRIYDSLYDQYIYIDLAKGLIQGRGLSMSYEVFVADAFKPTSIQPPLYPMLIAATVLLFGEKLIAIRLVQAVIGAGTCLIIYFIGIKLFNRKVGLLASFLTAIYPPLVMYTRPIMTETLYTFLLALILLTIFSLPSNRLNPKVIIFLGALFGITFLVRPEILVLSVLLVMGLIFRLLSRKRVADLRVASIGVVLGIGTFFLVVSPWIIRNWIVHGEPILFPTKGGLAALDNGWLIYMRETNPEWSKGCEFELKCAIPDFSALSEVERNRYTVNLSMQFIRDHPGFFIRTAISRLMQEFPLTPREILPPPVGYQGVRVRPQDGYDLTSLDDFPLYFTFTEGLRVWSFRLLFLIAIGGVIISIHAKDKSFLALYLPIGMAICTALMVNGKERFRISIDPYLIIIASFCLITLREKWQIHSALTEKTS